MISRETGRMALAALRLAHDMGRRTRSEAAQIGLAVERTAGRRYTCHAGYGYTWVGRRGHQRRVPDEYEQAVIEKIAAWREAGHSFYRIAAHLLRHRVPTADGREWSPDRVRRAFRAWTAKSAKKSGPTGGDLAGGVGGPPPTCQGG